jgi:hypothetical protein
MDTLLHQTKMDNFVVQRNETLDSDSPEKNDSPLPSRTTSSARKRRIFQV